MAGSNYDEMVTNALSAMSGKGASQRLPISSISSPLLSIYLGFLGFGCGIMVGVLTSFATFFTGIFGAVSGVVLAYVLRARWRRSADAALPELSTEAHKLEQEAIRLEAEVARQSGAFDKWEKK